MNELPVVGAAMQLKRYWIDPDRWDDYLRVWERIAAVRRRCGFEIPFACADRANGIFTWAISHSAFAAGAAAYYADPERKQVSRTDYDPHTGTYSDDDSRGGPHTVEEYVLKAEISFVTPVTIP